MKYKIYNSSDFQSKYLQRVWFWLKIFFLNHDFEEEKNFKKHDFEEKIIFKKHDFEETIILKGRFWKNFCTQNITFWFILPGKMRKSCVLRAILKSTILKKKKFF